MAEEDETHVLEVINKAVTAVAVSNKDSLNHQSKSSNNFMTVLSNSLQEHFYTLQM